ncbi:FKBP-type peptidyl-prolyl cis-trans isomerase [Bacteroidota bacterium]
MISTNRIRDFLIASLSVTLLLVASCREPVRPVEATANIRLNDDKLIDYNKRVVKTEDQQIEDFLQRYGWDVKQTSTGLRYLIYKKGSGRRGTVDMEVRFNYTIKLLNGMSVYSSDSLGEKSFILGHGRVESGLEEGMLLLREGDRAKFIIPSHLAFGLLGDQQKIPPGASLVYDVEILEFKTPK